MAVAHENVKIDGPHSYTHAVLDDLSNTARGHILRFIEPNTPKENVTNVIHRKPLFIINR